VNSCNVGVNPPWVQRVQAVGTVRAKTPEDRKDGKSPRPRGSRPSIAALARRLGKELREALYDEWNPEGPTEIDKVESIAMGMWLKRRRQRYLQKRLEKCVGIGNAFLRRPAQLHPSGLACWHAAPLQRRMSTG
jgi:hypothetical protein